MRIINGINGWGEQWQLTPHHNWSAGTLYGMDTETTSADPET